MFSTVLVARLKNSWLKHCCKGQKSVWLSSHIYLFILQLQKGKKKKPSGLLREEICLKDFLSYIQQMKYEGENKILFFS